MAAIYDPACAQCADPDVVCRHLLSDGHGNPITPAEFAANMRMLTPVCAMTPAQAARFPPGYWRNHGVPRELQECGLGSGPYGECAVCKAGPLWCASVGERFHLPAGYGVLRTAPSAAMAALSLAAKSPGTPKASK